MTMPDHPPIPNSRSAEWHKMPMKRSNAPNMRRPMAQTLTLQEVQYYCIPIQHIDCEARSNDDYRQFYVLQRFFLPDVVDSHSVPVYCHKVTDDQGKEEEVRMIAASIFYPSLVIHGVCYMLSPRYWEQEFQLAERKMKEDNDAMKREQNSNA